MRRHHQLLAAPGLAIAIAALALAGCGSSKPSYCSKVNDLKTSVQGLTNVNVVQNGTNSLKSQVQKIQSNGQDVVNAAKSDFPQQSSALSTSLTSLSNAVKQLPSSPSPSNIAALASNAAAVATAAKDFANATSSKCS